MIQKLYLWACERLYHELAWSYDTVSLIVSAGGWPAWRRLALELAPDGPLLELGFGTGALLAEGATAGRSIVGLDLSRAMHRVAARRLAGVEPKPPRVESPAQALPFADGSFTGVIATFPAPYILDPVTLAECRRVLRPGGQFIIVGLWVTAHRDGWQRWLPVFYGEPAATQVEQMTQRVRAAGFAVSWERRRVEWAEVGVLVGSRGE
ncbi:MAG: methyltransferase domain-containing protein [Anaerolineales bacterium]|nr:methyltransferase domain-containing protein [Anaerolineales bacterium]